MDQQRKDIRRIKRARMAVIALIATVAVILLAGPAVGYYVDTRVYPGGPPNVVEVHDFSGKVVDSYEYDHDTAAWVWLAVPYSVYFVVGVITLFFWWADVVSNSRRRTGMDSIWAPLPEVKQLTTNSKAEKIIVEPKYDDPFRYR
jgi:H+/Cl- antiporter ClcA